jgi:hypothetical protein
MVVNKKMINNFIIMGLNKMRFMPDKKRSGYTHPLRGGKHASFILHHCDRGVLGFGINI